MKLNEDIENFNELYVAPLELIIADLRLDLVDAEKEKKQQFWKGFAWGVGGTTVTIGVVGLVIWVVNAAQ